MNEEVLATIEASERTPYRMHRRRAGERGDEPAPEVMGNARRKSATVETRTGGDRSELARRFLPWSMTALTATFFLAEAWPLRPPLDDAFIYFRYAQNLAEGHGLVYNLGERVEGLTNLLWTLLLAGGIRLGFEAPETAHVLDLAAGVAALLAACAFARVGLPSSRAWIAGLAPALLLAGASFTYWSTAGLGTTFFVAFVTGALAAQASGRMGLATLAALLATLTRPEGALTAAVIFGFHLAWHHREGWRAWRQPALYALGVLLLTGFRLAYYGSPVPNTFYAKVGGIPLQQGVRYLQGFLEEGAAPLVLLAVPALFRGPRGWPAATLAVSTAAYVVAVGGDVFPLRRFLLPVLPCLIGLALHGALVAFETRRWLGGVAVAGLVLSFSIYVFGGPVAARRAPLPTARNERLSDAWAGLCAFHNVSSIMAFTVKDLADRGEPIRLVATGAIGAIGYYSRLPILDFFGLIDPHIARDRRPLPKHALRIPGHQRSNADYVISRKPDYMMVAPSGVQIRYAAAIEIRAHPAFKRDYELVAAWGLYRRKGLPGPTQPPGPVYPVLADCER
jgi:hypothetical protein